MLSLQQLRSRLSRSFRLRPTPVLKSRYSIASEHNSEVSTPPLGTRMPAMSKGATGIRGPQISSIFKLRTLRPECLEEVGQEAIDLSGKSRPRVPILDGCTLECAYGYEDDASGRPRWARYPEGTRGFFYFHHPSEGPELCAGVRFRICESAAGFARGRDLLDTRGDVWGPNMLELVKHEEKRSFLTLCRTEQLIDAALIADIAKLDLSQRVDQHHFLLSEPFALNLAHSKRQFTYVTRAKVVRLMFPRQASSTTPNFFPYTGSIKARFELSNLPEHKKRGPTLVVRVLDVVDPIARHPHYDGLFPVPVLGTLLQRILRGQLRVLAIPLRRQPMAEDLLALAKTTWA